MSFDSFNAIGYSFSAIGEAKNNWEKSRDNLLSYGNYWSLSNGTHYTTDIGVPQGLHDSSGMKIVKGNGYIRYKVISDNGMISTG